MMSALTTAQNLLRVIIPEATDITKKIQIISCLCTVITLWIPVYNSCLIVFPKNFIYPTPDAALCPVVGAKLE
ncbi:MAG: hypothetical protein CL941_03760 [Desulfobacter sp.]|jgi:hypothetical protein|nr:hypothetical protein [Desulfobacter sp.]|tara:strand:+ start:10402 stop:10620 length:219 start_codon:yes stop_codon:yes gene_type:complete